MSHSNNADSTKIGSSCKGRYVTPDDQEYWGKERAKRKAKKVILDPYRYLD